jgi:ElaB/YqjD/DUF883 family membrane-anchored ribosome-binding protein
MDANNPKVLAQKLAARQASAAAAIGELRRALEPGELTKRTRQAVSTEAKQATLDAQGMPKPWVLIAVAVAVGLAVTGIVVRLARRSK